MDGWIIYLVEGKREEGEDGIEWCELVVKSEPGSESSSERAVDC